MRSHWEDQPSEFIRSLMRERHADSLAINAAVRELAAGHESPDGFHRRDYHRLHVGPYRVHCIIDDEVLHVVRVDKVPGP